jgi:hypothetical protein
MIKLEIPFASIFSLVKELDVKYNSLDTEAFIRCVAQTDFHVNTYIEDKRYGGPEEGGWWYTFIAPQEDKCFQFYCGPQESTLTYLRRVNEAHQARVAWCDYANSRRNSDISSVISEGRYISLIESHVAKYMPDEPVHYE